MEMNTKMLKYAHMFVVCLVPCRHTPQILVPSL